MENKSMTYREAGVDIDAANKSVKMMRQWVERTRRPEVLGELGSFGGLFALDTSKYQEPVLVSGTDGVGTKLKVAQMMKVHDTVGIDLVAMCVNDILVHGAEPLFFLDYIGLGRLNPELVEAIVKGVSEGCLQAGCSLVGGETAEMPGFYSDDEYDLAGFAVGVVDRQAVIDGSAIKEGDQLIALASTGLHSNGFSLARQVLLEKAGLKMDAQVESLGGSLGEAMLKPTRIYVKSVMQLLGRLPVHGMAHITGGGILENLERVLPEGLGVQMEISEQRIPAIFKLIQQVGNVEQSEMFRTFNMGIGFVVVLSGEAAAEAIGILEGCGETAWIIGSISCGESGLSVVPA